MIGTQRIRIPTCRRRKCAVERAVWARRRPFWPSTSRPPAPNHGQRRNDDPQDAVAGKHRADQCPQAALRRGGCSFGRSGLFHCSVVVSAVRRVFPHRTDSVIGRGQQCSPTHFLNSSAALFVAAEQGSNGGAGRRQQYGVARTRCTAGGLPIACPATPWRSPPARHPRRTRRAWRLSTPGAVERVHLLAGEGFERFVVVASLAQVPP